MEKKSTPSVGEILKDSTEFIIDDLTNLINYCLEKGVFLAKRKIADVWPFLMKNNNLENENYRAVSILPLLSKVYEGIIYKRIDNFVSPKFSPSLYGFWKNSNFQYSFLKMIETWKQHLDSGILGDTLLMDLSKTFYTIDHSLVLTKFEAYGFSGSSLKLLQSYLSNRFQRTYINDIFFFINNTYICNYADDNTLHTIGVQSNFSILQKLVL